MRWKLWYGPNITFSSEDGDWAEAPHIGVLGLVTPDLNVGREFDHGARGEFYAWWPGASKPWGFDRVGILDYLSEIGWPTSTRLSNLSLDDWRDARVKLGRSVDNGVFHETLAAMNADPEFPPKSANSLREKIL